MTPSQHAPLPPQSFALVLQQRLPQEIAPPLQWLVWQGSVMCCPLVAMKMNGHVGLPRTLLTPVRHSFCAVATRHGLC